MKASTGQVAAFVADKATESLMAIVSNLKFRWEDEREYEDFEEYCKVIRRALPPGATNERITSRPFRVEYDNAGYHWRVSATGKSVRVERRPLVQS